MEAIQLQSTIRWKSNKMTKFVYSHRLRWSNRIQLDRKQSVFGGTVKIWRENWLNSMKLHTTRNDVFLDETVKTGLFNYLSKIKIKRNRLKWEDAGMRPTEVVAKSVKEMNKSMENELGSRDRWRPLSRARRSCWISDGPFRPHSLSLSLSLYTARRLLSAE